MIRITKHSRTLEILSPEGKLLFSCPVFLGKSPVGAKNKEGDMKTPEGRYFVTHIHRQSKYHIALGVSYPGKQDALSALSENRIGKITAIRILLCDFLRVRPPWKTILGGFIMIHGEHPDKKTGDWTAGCIAVTNDSIDKIAKIVKRGEKVEILP